MQKAPRPTIIRFFGLATALAIVAACGEMTTTPQPLDSDLRLQAGHAHPVVLAANGFGEVTAPNGNQDRFAFRAKKHADGSVTGEANFRSEFFAPNQKQRGRVVCMARIKVGDADVVALGTDIPRPPSAPEQAGPFFIMLAIDNGEGHQASPDQLLPDFVPAGAYPDGPPNDAAESCESIVVPGFVLMFFADLDRGDIRVTP